MFKTIDGATFKAEDEADLVTQLRKDCDTRTPTATDRQFMNEAAFRATVQTGFIVRDDDPANFVGDLIAAGLVSEITTH